MESHPKINIHHRLGYFYLQEESNPTDLDMSSSTHVVKNFRILLKHVKSLPSSQNWTGHIKSKVDHREHS